MVDLERQLDEHRRCIEVLFAKQQDAFRCLLEAEFQKYLKGIGCHASRFEAGCSSVAAARCNPLPPTPEVASPMPIQLTPSRSTTLESKQVQDQLVPSPPPADNEELDWEEFVSVSTQQSPRPSPTYEISSLESSVPQRRNRDSERISGVSACSVGDHNQWNSLAATITHARSKRKSKIVRLWFHNWTGMNAWTEVIKEPDTQMVRISKTWAFSSTISVLILANALFIGYQSEQSVHLSRQKPPKDDPEWFNVVSRVFATIFSIELIFRIYAYRRAFIHGRDWAWNTFDSLLVLSSAVEELLGILDFTIFRTLRVLRMVRVLRVIRVLRFFRELRVMVCSILHTLSSLAWALVLLMLIMYLFSIIFMQAAAGYMRDAEPGDQVVHELGTWYTSIFGTMYSLFMSISGGQDWYEIQLPLKHISWVYGLFFALYVFFVAFGVLNVLMAVFVERASESGKLDKDLMTHAEHKQTTKFLEEMHEMFQDIDTEKRGSITRAQLSRFAQDENVKAYLKTRYLDGAVHRLFQVMSRDGEAKQTLTAEEFMSGMMRLKGGAKNADVVMLLHDTGHLYRKLSVLIREHQGFISKLTPHVTLSRNSGISSTMQIKSTDTVAQGSPDVLPPSTHKMRVGDTSTTGPKRMKHCRFSL